MTERNDEGRHAAPEPSAEVSAQPSAQQGQAVDLPAEDTSYARPDGVAGGFEPRNAPEPYRPPPPTVAPADVAVFGRPAGADPFAPAPGERLAPKHTTPAPVPRLYSDAYGTTPNAREGFDPAPGDRIAPAGPQPESPWWKSDARIDPWRDPSAPFWLGRGAVFGPGGPAQLGADQDTETAVDELPDTGEDEDLEDDDEKSGNVRRVRFGMRTSVLLVVALLLAGAVGHSSKCIALGCSNLIC